MKSKKSQKKNKKPTKPKKITHQRFCLWHQIEQHVQDVYLAAYLCKKCEQELNQAEQELQDEQGKGSI